MADIRQIAGVEARTGGIIDVNGAWSTLQKRSKKGVLSKRGKTTIEVAADPLVVAPDATGAAGLYAAAVADEARRQLAAIGRTVSPATVERRRRYANDKSSLSYAKRYANTSKRGISGLTASGTGVDTARGAGKKTGAGHMPPIVSSQWGTDSGRLATLSVRVRKRSTGEATATINVAANRLDPLLFDAKQSAFAEFRRELQREAPVFAGNLTADPQTRAAVERVLQSVERNLVATSAKRLDELLRQRRLLIAQILRTATGLDVTKIVSFL